MASPGAAEDHRGDPGGSRRWPSFRRRLLCEKPETLDELAVDFGVSRERTRQLGQDRLTGRIRSDLTRNLGDALEEQSTTIVRDGTESSNSRSR